MALDKKNLPDGIRKMRAAAEQLLAWADDLERSVAGSEASAAEAAAEPAAADAAPAAPAAPPTRAEVKAFLTSVCAAGYSGQVKALIASFGAVSLSGVPDECLGQLMEQAALLGAQAEEDAHAG